MPDFSVIVILHLGDCVMWKPFFFHVTEIGGVPLYVLSRSMDFPCSTLKSLNFFTKVAGSTKWKAKSQTEEGGNIHKCLRAHTQINKNKNNSSNRDKPFTKR